MSWGRLDDSFFDHPKVVGLRLELIGLWAKGLGYCGRHLTDGAIRRALLPQLTGFPLSRATRLADELVKAGLWEPAGADYLVHDYLDWNPSRREVLAERERRSRAGQTAARARWSHASSQSDSGCDSHAARIADGNAGRIETATEVPCTRPDPSRPDPETPPTVPPKGDGAASRKRRKDHPPADPPGFGEFWNAYPFKGARLDAVKAWREIDPDADLQVQMLAALGRQMGWATTAAERKEFLPRLPDACRWLKKRRWTDEPPAWISNGHPSRRDSRSPLPPSEPVYRRRP